MQFYRHRVFCDFPVILHIFNAVCIRTIPSRSHPCYKIILKCASASWTPYAFILYQNVFYDIHQNIALLVTRIFPLNFTKPTHCCVQ